MQRNDAQVSLKLARPLRAELEDWAAAESRGLSSLIRKILVDQAAKRITERGAVVEAR